MQISVIIPCHNAASYIRETLDSIATQQLQPHEVIVIDDASTDDSREIVQQWGENHPDIALVQLRVEARNAAAARNAGIAVASGDWIAFLDADDLWYPHHLSNAAAILSQGDAVGFMANHHFMESDGERRPIPETMRHALNETSTGLDPDDWVAMSQRGFHFGHSTVLLNLQRTREVGGFDVEQKRRHDLDLWLRVLHGHTWAYHAQEAAIYRTDTPGSISKNVIDCELYYLRALVKNYPAYPISAMDNLIAVSARRLMSLSFVDGTAQQQRAARAAAWPHLSEKLRAFYRVSRAAKPVFRAAIRAKRRLFWKYQAAISKT